MDNRVPRESQPIPPKLESTDVQSFASTAPFSAVAGAGVEPELPLRIFGGYELLKVLGVGGMGEVHKARHRPTGRIVAIKLIRRDLLSRLTPQQRQHFLSRFRTEVRAAAVLQHDHVVRVYDVGEVESVHYYAMQFVEGRSLRELLAAGPVDPRAAAKYIQQVASAVAAAHAHQPPILHRDIKPHNIMLDRQTGRALLADFGLAKFAEADQELTLDGMLGSPPYMSPEQTVNAKGVTTAADIYSLGATLYHLLTGQPPFKSDSLAQTIRQIHETEPVPPRKLQRTVPRDLETICLKCLRKTPESRYETAAALAEDIERWLDHRPIRARSVGLLEATWLWCKRRPAIAGLTTAVLLTVLTAICVISFQRLHFEITRREDERGRAATLVRQVLTSRSLKLSDALDDVELLKTDAVPLLQVAYDDSSLDVGQRLRAACALASFQPVEVGFIVDSVAAADEFECANIASALRRDHSSAEALRAHFRNKSDPSAKARLAILLLHLSDMRAAQMMLDAQADPSLRSAFIHELATWHESLLDYLPHMQTNDPDFRSGICLSVGRIPFDELGEPAAKAAWKSLLIELHQTTVDGGSHSAAGWALRKWGIETPNVSMALQKPSAAVGEQAAPERGWYVNKLGMSFVRIPSGSFARVNAEGYKQKVSITSDFWIGNQEVTNQQFEAYLRRHDASGTSANSELQTSTKKNLPCSGIAWQMAVDFCNWLSEQEGLSKCYELTSGDYSPLPDGDGYRLPTEAEWEFACRAGTATSFFHGEDTARLTEYAVFNSLSSETCGSKMSNCWGLFDAHGNVEEWCSDWFQDYEFRDVIDPVGPPVGARRVLRGGAFSGAANSLRASARSGFSAANVIGTAGLRVARNASPKLPISLNATRRWLDFQTVTVTEEVGKPIDLIPLIDVDRDRVTGQWSLEDNELAVSQQGFSRIELPVIPPQEYDLEVLATRTLGNLELMLGIIYQGRTCGVIIDGWGGMESGLSVDNALGGGILRAKQKLITNQTPFKVICQVRHDMLVVTLDGREILRYDGPPGWNSIIIDWSGPHECLLMLGAHGSAYRFHSIKVVPISAGTRLVNRRSLAPPDRAFRADGSIFLDDYPESSVQLGYGSLGKYGATGYPPIRTSGSHDPAEVVVGGEKFEHALAMHPSVGRPAKVTYHLGGKYAAFTGTVAIMDQVKPTPFAGELAFLVSGDGKTLWESGPLTVHGQKETFNVDVAGVQEIEIRAACQRDQQWAWAVWLDPMLTPQRNTR